MRGIGWGAYNLGASVDGCGGPVSRHACLPIAGLSDDRQRCPETVPATSQGTGAIQLLQGASGLVRKRRATIVGPWEIPLSSDGALNLSGCPVDAPPRRFLVASASTSW